MKSFDLSLVFRERRFLGLRVALYTLPLAAIGYVLFLMGWSQLGLFLFFVAWFGMAIGFVIHLRSWRDRQ